MESVGPAQAFSEFVGVEFAGKFLDFVGNPDTVSIHPEKGKVITRGEMSNLPQVYGILIIILFAISN